MPALKCPNPVCRFKFDPKSCPPGATLGCPRCQTRFQVKGGEVVGVSDEAPRTPRPADPVLARLTRPAVLVAAAVGLVAVIAAVTTLTILSRQKPEVVDAGPKELIAAGQNFAVTPPAGWATDPVVLNKLNVNAFCYRHPTGRGWVALAVRDYKTRAPFAAELDAAARSTLAGAFTGVSDRLTFESATLAGKPARKAAFRGEFRDPALQCVGEVTTLSDRGIGYWFYAFGAESEAAGLAGDFEQFRDSFRLLDERKSWQPERGTEEVFRGTAEPSIFSLTTLSSEWSHADSGDDPKRQLTLEGRIKTAGDRRLSATATVWVLDPSGPVDAQADAWVRERYTPDPEVFGPTEITPHTEQVQGEPAVPTEELPTAPVTRLKVAAKSDGVSTSSDKLVVYRVATLANKTVVAEASCPWNQRSVWERRLVQLVASLGPNR